MYKEIEKSFKQSKTKHKIAINIDQKTVFRIFAEYLYYLQKHVCNLNIYLLLITIFVSHLY